MKKRAILVALLFAMPAYAAYDGHRGWYIQDEGIHHAIREWWNIDIVFATGGNYSLTASFEYEKETPAANLFFTLFDRDADMVYDLGSYNDDIAALQHHGSWGVNLTYHCSWLRGTYPRYRVHFERNNVVVDATLEAVSRYVFVVEDEGGILPIGLGYYRYAFIPKCVATGWMSIDGVVTNFEGVGYYEHVWGNWSYHNPLRGATLKPYLTLARWWWEHANITWDAFTLSTNNPFGYDWAWGAFDNGWSMFYGAVPFWIGEIPFGVLYLFRDGEVMEFGDISYRYIDGVFYHGFYIPTAIKVTAEGAGTLSLVLKMGTTPHVYEDELDSLYWDRLILYENPGRVTGTYVDKQGNTTSLAGFCEVEIERQGSIFQYLMLQLSRNAGMFEILFISCLLNVIFGIEFSLNPFTLHFSFSHIGEHTSQG